MHLSRNVKRKKRLRFQHKSFSIRVFLETEFKPASLLASYLWNCFVYFSAYYNTENSLYFVEILEIVNLLIEKFTKWYIWFAI